MCRCPVGPPCRRARCFARGRSSSRIAAERNCAGARRQGERTRRERLQSGYAPTAASRIEDQSGDSSERGRRGSGSSRTDSNRKERAMSPQNKPSIVFCHGIWADGTCFSKLIPPLRADGFEVITAQYNLDTAQTDIDSVIRTLGRVSSPSILVGHSYGGSVITAAGTDERVAGLVYVAALGPDETETAAGQQAKFPTTPLFGKIEVADGRIWLLPEGIEDFAGDLSEEEKQVVWAAAAPPAVDLFDEKVPGVAWR